MVEAAAPRTGGDDHQSIVGRAALLVGVEPLVEELSQEPACLGNARRQPVFGREDAGLVVLRIADHVPNGREAQSDNRRILRAIDEFVDLARLKSAVEYDVCRVGNTAAIPEPREVPTLAGDDLMGCFPPVSYGQNVCGVLGIGNGIGTVTAMRQRQRCHRGVHGPVATDKPRDWGAVLMASTGYVQTQHAGMVRHVELPADPDHRQSEAQQQSISEGVRVIRIEAGGCGAVEILR